MTLLKPEFMAGETYPAIRDRVVLSHGGAVQPGVWDATDFKVVPDTNMLLSVLSGFALVPADHPGNQGLYHIENTSSNVGATITAAHATLPRIDQVMLVVNDPAMDPALGSALPVIQVLPGVPTAGTTLDTRAGAVATFPSASIRLADVLVPAAATSISAGNIRDRRTWARGAFFRSSYNHPVGGGVATTSTSPVPLQKAELGKRLEIYSIGTPIEVFLHVFAYSGGAANVHVAYTVERESSPNPALPIPVVPATGSAGGRWTNGSLSIPVMTPSRWVVTVPAGSHFFYPVWSVDWQTGVTGNTPGLLMILSVRELLRPDFANNGTT